MSRYVASVYFGHDASVALVGNGKIVHLESERFTRKKHDHTLSRAEVRERYLQQALRLAGADLSEVAALVEIGCQDMIGIGRSARHWNRTLSGEREEGRTDFLGPQLPGYRLPHHLAHAAYSFYTSPFEDAPIAVMDGGGDSWVPEGWSADSKWDQRHDSVFAASGRAAHLFGSSAATFTLDVEFDQARGGRGDPRAFVGQRSLGGDWNDLSIRHFGHWTAAGSLMAAAGVPEDRIEAEAGIAVSDLPAIRELQARTTETFANLLPRGVGSTLCLGGGCALNGIAAYALLCREDVTAVHVPPAVHDGGLTVGAALYVLHALLGEPRVRYAPETVAFSGYTDGELDGPPPIDEICGRLMRGEIVAVAHGRAESGPRALGHRSILSLPRPLSRKDDLNRVKGRRPFRPVAPVVLRSTAESYFRLKNSDCYPYMTMIAEATERAHEEIPAGLHYDNSARVQVVDPDASVLGPIVAEIWRQTGVPVVLNTSFNLSGEAIANDGAQSRDTFARSRGVSALFIGGNGERR